MKPKKLLIPDLNFAGTFPTAQDSTTKGKWVKIGANYELIEDFTYFNIFSVQAISNPKSPMDQAVKVLFQASNFTPFINSANSYAEEGKVVDRDYAYDYFGDYMNTLGETVELTVTPVPSVSMYGQGEAFPYKMIKIIVESSATSGELQLEFTQK